MQLSRRNLLVYGLLAAVWALVFLWQLEEHARVREAAKADLRYRSKDIARSVGACIRAGIFRGRVFEDRLDSALNELVSGQTNDPGHPTELISVALLNAEGSNVLSAGRGVDLGQVQEGERWGVHAVTLINPINLGDAVILPRRPDYTNGPSEAGRDFPRRQPEQGPPASTDLAGPPPGPPPSDAPPPPSPREGRSRDGGRRSGRLPWLRGMSEEEYQSLVEKQSLHWLVLAMSTESLQAASLHDLWLRTIIMLLATISVLGSGLSWRNFSKTSDLQLRLVRASELNTHLKEMNLAAAGLAHETRNPLNIIRGLAQMISKGPETAAETRQKVREIIDEADKVAAQLNEFINYSRPREVRRTHVALNSVVNEVVRALNYDLEEKKIRLEVKGEQLNIEADEQMLRQALFNLLLNAVQAVEPGGEIEVFPQRRDASEGMLEVRDNGPGVPPENRTEIFKPYFTTQKTGTGLGLAVVQQIVLAHGWEIECLPNDPVGAVFRITHLKLVT
jgi:signal transduction histidine kinase